MRASRIAFLIAVAFLCASLAQPLQRKRKKKADEELPNQTLELPKDPPNAVTAETGRLVFHVSALSSKGLLSQQVRDALKDLSRQWRGAVPVKLRAFVAGSGDLRRVPSIVSETFTEKRQPIPAVSVVQVGALPLEGAQVVVESIAVAKKAANPNGLALISGQQTAIDKPFQPAAPLAAKSLDQLKAAVRSASAADADVLRVTCFLTALDGLDRTRTAVREAFPAAAVNLVQSERAGQRTLAECEAVARLKNQPAEPVAYLNPSGLPKSPYYSQIAMIGAPKLAFTGTQMAFGYDEKAIRLALQRLSKSLDEVHTPVRNTVFSHIYPVTNAVADRFRSIRFDFFDKSRPPASTLLLFEGLQSGDASVGIEVVAVAP